MAILDAKGKELSPGTIEVMVRLGGWQAVTGARTVLRTYARKVIDEFVDASGLSLGYNWSDAEWARRKAEYLGVPRFPSEPVVDPGRTPLPLQLRVHAWRSKEWLCFQDRSNRVCALIGAAANADAEIMPVNRYCEARRAFNVYIKRRPGCPLVLEYRALRKRRALLWQACVKEAQRRCESSFYRSGVVEDPNVYMFAKRYLRFLREVDIGNVKMDGTINDGDWDAPADWDRTGTFVWGKPRCGGRPGL